MVNVQDIIGELGKPTPAFDIGTQKKESQDYLKNYTAFIAGQEALPAMYGRLAGQFQIPQLQEQTQRLGEVTEDITSGLFALPESVAGRSRESLMTESGKQRTIQAEAQPMQENLAKLSSLGQKFGARLSTAQTNLGTMMGLYQAEQEKQLKPWDREFNILTVQQAREYSGYTFKEEMELDRLIAKGTLTDAEAGRANELAMKELEFKNNLNQIAAKGKEDRETKAAKTDLATLYKSIFG